MQSDHLLGDFNQNLNVSTNFGKKKKKNSTAKLHAISFSRSTVVSPEDGWRQNIQQNKNVKDNGKRGAEKKTGNKATRTEYGRKTV
jgi:hypothetical protein